MSTPFRRYFMLLATYLKPQWRRVLFLASTLVVSIILQLLGPQIIAFFIATIEQNGPVSHLIGAGIFYGLVSLITQGTAIANAYLSTNVAWSATNQLRTDLVAHCLALDMHFHKARTAGEMIERIDGDVNTLSNFFSNLVIHLLTSTILLLSILILFYWIDWRIGIAMTCFSLAVLLFLTYLRRWAIPLWKESRQMSAQFYSFLGERLTGTEDLRANGATTYALQRFYQILQQWFPLYLRSNRISANMGLSSLFLFICGTVLALSMGTYQWMQGTMQVSTIYLLYAYTQLLSEPINQLQVELQNLQQAEACIQRIETLLQTQSSLNDGSQQLQLNEAPALTFKNVTFAYSEDPVLHNLSFHVASGHKLGILGRTGSGKSTIARLIFRLYDPQTGSISLNDQALMTFQLRDLRQSIALVSQDVQIFHASVRDNLTLFNPTIPDHAILKAIHDVGLSYWHRSLPEGLDTIIGTTGEGLSAGEAQLLAFARAFLQQPHLVILDEASSRLDPLTEKRIEKATTQLLQGRSALIIAHRLATIQRVDDILILEDGKVIEHGPRLQLSNDPSSHFTHLLTTGLEEEVRL